MSKQGEWLNYALSKLNTKEEERAEIAHKIDSIINSLKKKGYEIEFMYGELYDRMYGEVYDRMIVSSSIHHVSISMDMLIGAPKDYTLKFIDHRMIALKNKHGRESS